MRYVMNQKMWSWGDDFTIRDESGETAFQVRGEVFSLGDRLRLEDPEGNELAFIAQRVLSWGPTYEIHVQGIHLATVKKELFTFFRCRYHIELASEGPWIAEGDFLDYEYTVSTGEGVPLARVSKQWFAWTDTYGIEVADGADPVLLLAIAVVLDMACHGDKG